MVGCCRVGCEVPAQSSSLFSASVASTERSREPEAQTQGGGSFPEDGRGWAPSTCLVLGGRCCVMFYTALVL
jgi:hypothetical protein